MDLQTIILIISGAIAVLETGSWVGIAAFLAKFIKKRIEDSTGLKGDLRQLNKQLSESLLENKELKCRLDALTLEMKGIKQNGCIRKNREAKN